MNKTYKYIQLPFLEGKPLEVGDKVDGYSQEGAEVIAIMSEKMVVVRSTIKGGYGYPDVAYPLLLWTVSELKRHREPDTMERIEEDAMKTFYEYWGCHSMIDCEDCSAVVDGKKPYERYNSKESCLHAQKLDLLHRQRKILEYDEEVEEKGEEYSRTD